MSLVMHKVGTRYEERVAGGVVTCNLMLSWPIQSVTVGANECVWVTLLDDDAL